MKFATPEVTEPALSSEPSKVQDSVAVETTLQPPVAEFLKDGDLRKDLGTAEHVSKHKGEARGSVAAEVPEKAEGVTQTHDRPELDASLNVNSGESTQGKVVAEASLVQQPMQNQLLKNRVLLRLKRLFLQKRQQSQLSLLKK